MDLTDEMILPRSLTLTTFFTPTSASNGHPARARLREVQCFLFSGCGIFGACKGDGNRIGLLNLVNLSGKKVRLGPSLHVYTSPGILSLLQQNYNIMPIGEAATDLKLMMQGN